MQPAASPDEFVVAPVGRFLSGPNYLVWCRAANLGGTMIWGRPGESDAQAITRLWEYDRQLPPGHDAITDVSRLEHVDPAGFEAIIEYTRRRLPTYEGRLRRHAVVHPPSVLGAVVAGFYPLLGPRHEWQLFQRLDEAVRWIGVSDGDALLGQLDRLISDGLGVPPVVRRLREWLVNNVHMATVESAARGLLSSPRSLQRELQAAQSSFRLELERARAQAASQLLVDTDLKVDEVARRVGCASHTALDKLMRRALGVTPSQLRGSR